MVSNAASYMAKAVDIQKRFTQIWYIVPASSQAKSSRGNS